MSTWLLWCMKPTRRRRKEIWQTNIYCSYYWLSMIMRIKEVIPLITSLLTKTMDGLMINTLPSGRRGQGTCSALRVQPFFSKEIIRWSWIIFTKTWKRIQSVKIHKQDDSGNSWQRTLLWFGVYHGGNNEKIFNVSLIVMLKGGPLSTAQVISWWTNRRDLCFAVVDSSAIFFVK